MKGVVAVIIGVVITFESIIYAVDMPVVVICCVEWMMTGKTVR